MLVLSRHRDESIMIGDNIVITIVDIRGDKVRLGIEAPSDIPVHRQEVYEAIQRENRKASQLRPGDTRISVAPIPRAKALSGGLAIAQIRTVMPLLRVTTAAQLIG